MGYRFAMKRMQWPHRLPSSSSLCLPQFSGSQRSVLPAVSKHSSSSSSMFQVACRAWLRRNPSPQPHAVMLTLPCLNHAAALVKQSWLLSSLKFQARRSCVTRGGMEEGVGLVLGDSMQKVLRRFCLLTATFMSTSCLRSPAQAAEDASGSGPIASSPSSNSEGSRPLVPLLPPRAKKVEHIFPTLYGEDRKDFYYWLRDDERKDDAVLDYIKEENAYTEAAMADTKQLQEDLYKEMRARIKEEDVSVPLRYGPWWYYERNEEGSQYKLLCRRAIPEGAGPGTLNEVMAVGENAQPEEVLLDENARFASYGKEFYKAKSEVSPDHKLLAVAEDTEGGEKYDVRVIDLATQEEIGSPIPHTSGNVTWAKDNKTLFYITKDQLDRPFKVWRHALGSDPKDDVCVYHEDDDSFYLDLSLSFSEDFLLLHSGSAITSHVLSLRADEPLADFVQITPRVHGVDTSVSHRGSHFFVERRSEEFFNSELLICPVDNPELLTTLIPHRPDEKLEGVAVFENHLVAMERASALQSITIYDLPPTGQPITSLSPGRAIAFDLEAYALSAESSQFKSHLLRFSFSSMKTPDSVYDYDMVTGERALKKITPILGGFEEGNYETARRWATAPDGVKVPISMLYRKDMAKLDSTDPMLLYGYGAYEITVDPDFRRDRLSLVDRGFVYAIAHIRGGGMMGRKWYEDGKFLKKRNTFTDFVACAEYLIAQKWAAPDKICIDGRSAGGLLIGATLNLRPDLFQAAIAGVPFVDVLTTLLDQSIPLTTLEFEEWGNPQKEEYYRYIRTYSPVDNVEAKDYPNILVTAGLHDPRVGYWEPAKWVAKLRDTKTDTNLLLFKCDLGAGHFSKSGRFDKLKETALEFAFLLKALNLATPSTTVAKL